MLIFQLLLNISTFAFFIVSKLFLHLCLLLISLSNAGVKSSPIEPILILDSEDECPVEAISPQKESLWSPKVPKREQYSLLPEETGSDNHPNPRDRTVPNGAYSFSGGNK